MVGYSYCTNIIPIGGPIMLVMDASDVLVAIFKLTVDVSRDKVLAIADFFESEIINLVRSAFQIFSFKTNRRTIFKRIVVSGGSS